MKQIKSILNDKRFAVIERIERPGYEHRYYYYINTFDGEELFLKLFPLRRIKSVKEQFEIMQLITEHAVPTPAPIEYGICKEGAYFLTEWTVGKPLKDVLPALSAREQYAVGLEIGNILRNIHSIPSDNAPARRVVFIDRIIRSIKEVADSENFASFEQGEILRTIYQYCMENSHLARNRFRCLLHADVHLANIFYINGELQIFDFKSFKYGDPWYDFRRHVRQYEHPQYLIGTIHGYFLGDPPQQFWPLYVFYKTAYAIEILRNEQFLGREKLLEKCCDDVLNAIPTWYVEYNDITDEYLSIFRNFTKSVDVEEQRAYLRKELTYVADMKMPLFLRCRLFIGKLIKN